VNKIKDIYSPFSAPEEKYVVKQAISKDTEAVDVYSEDAEMPGRIYIGDITSDGYPDILLTVKYLNSTTRAHILVSQECEYSLCASKAVKTKRRTFSLAYNQYQ